MGICAGKCRSTARLDGKVVVITGCNTGIGKECAKDFYLRGAKVIMACRNIEKANTALGDIEDQCKGQPHVGTLKTTRLDLSSLTSVRQCAEFISAEENKVDILLNNAGVMICPESRTEENFEMQMGTNHLGHFYFTMLLLPKIIASDSRPARIVNVASLAHIFGSIKFSDLNWEKRRYQPIRAYGASKLANIHFTKELTRRLKEEGIDYIHTYCLHPGIIQTELGRHLDKTIFPGLSWLFTATTKVLFKSIEEGAQTSIYCCVDEKTATETGLYYKDCHKTISFWNANKPENAKRLWEESLVLTGLGEGFNPFVQK